MAAVSTSAYFVRTILTDSSPLQRSPSLPWDWDTRTWDRAALMTPTCAGVTLSHIHS
jgi:hypothetical protein